jgi:hypothetical protein
MSELEKEVLKYNLLFPKQQPQQQQTQFTEILGLLIFAFMVMAYFDLQRQSKQQTPLNVPSSSRREQQIRYIPIRAENFSEMRLNPY